jgi:hypothetical protein
MVLRYLITGMGVAFAAFFVPRRSMDIEEIVMISFTATAVFAVLDQFAPNVYQSSLFGAGFGIGANQAGFEGFITQQIPKFEEGELKKRAGCMKWVHERDSPKAVNCNLDEFF